MFKYELIAQTMWEYSDFWMYEHKNFAIDFSVL